MTEPSPPSTPIPRPSQRYILPADLATALRGLPEGELMQLSYAVAAEVQRRDLQANAIAPLPVRPKAPVRRQKRHERIEPATPPARLNAIRAAIKAGVKPSVVARQFGVSPAAIKAALEGR